MAGSKCPSTYFRYPISIYYRKVMTDSYNFKKLNRFLYEYEIEIIKNT